jgi:hypothetical protein
MNVAKQIEAALEVRFQETVGQEAHELVNEVTNPINSISVIDAPVWNAIEMAMPQQDKMS